MQWCSSTHARAGASELVNGREVCGGDLFEVEAVVKTVPRVCV